MPAAVEQRLLFLIGAPRSGTTLLTRIFGGHSQIYARPESHLLSPLAHLGFYDTVDAAPYDHVQAAQAVQGFVGDLPRGELDYLDACRAYMDTLYGRMLAARGGGKRFFLDKTPANALILPFLTKLYPRARYIVLTRHPAAVFCSYAKSFFQDDYAAAQRFNPILQRYVPAIATLLRQGSVTSMHLRYEDLVDRPLVEVERLCAFAGLAVEPQIIEYGAHSLDGRGLGDPTGVERHSTPVPDSLTAWAADLAADPEHLRFVRALIDLLDDRDLEAWGYPREKLWAAVDEAANRGRPVPPPPALDWFQVQRKILRLLRRDIATSRFGRVVRSIRQACDVLLRG